jgi:hypothetical protein
MKELIRRLAVHIQTAVYRTSFEFAEHQLPQIANLSKI